MKSKKVVFLFKKTASFSLVSQAKKIQSARPKYVAYEQKHGLFRLNILILV